MNILSIDWDYFIDTDVVTRLSRFPDCGNESIGTLYNSLIWGARYSENKMQGFDLRTIGINEALYSKLLSIIDKNKNGFNLIVADSHAVLGELLMTELPIKEPIHIINIDHHSDLYDVFGNRKLDCGNWLNKIFEKTEQVDCLWIRNEDSNYTEIEDLPYKDKISIETDLSLIDGKHFDCIFLCRSAVWSPPHLDKEFLKLNRFLKKRAVRTIYEEDLVNRYNDKLNSEIDDLSKVYKNFYNKGENSNG